MQLDPTHPTADRRFARFRGWLDAALVGIVSIVTIAPHIDQFVRTDEERGPFVERRSAAAKPSTPRSLAALRTWPVDWQNYWNDTFGLRDVFLRGHSLLKVFGFGVSPTIDHVVGKDHWIFWCGSRVLDAWRGVHPLSEKELTAWRARLERNRDICAAAGARHLFVLIPEKVTAYSERLPERYTKIGPSRSDQLLEFLRDSKLDVLDLRPVIAKAKELDRPGDAMYFEQGTHWRTRGAAFALTAILDRLRPHFPALEPIPLDRYAPVAGDILGDSEASTMYIDADLPQDENKVELPTRAAQLVRMVVGPRVRETRRADRPDLPSALVFHDSFGVYLEDPLAESFSSLVMIWKQELDAELVARTRPSIVIEMYAERQLQNIDPAAHSKVTSISDRFRALTDSRFKLDPARVEVLTALYGTTFAARGTDDRRFVEVTTRGPTDCLALPEFDLRAKRLLVHYDITAPVATTLDLYYKRAGDATYLATSRIEAPLIAGRNEGVLEIGLDDLVERLALSPGRVAGTYALHALEVRAE